MQDSLSQGWGGQESKVAGGLEMLMMRENLHNYSFVNLLTGAEGVI